MRQQCFGKSVSYALFVLTSVMALCAQTATPTIVAPGLPAEFPEKEKPKPQTFAAGLTLTTDFDDNALNNNRNNQYNTLTVFAPHVGWSLFRARYDWKLEYEQGFSVSRPITAYNSRSRMLGTSLEFKISKRLVFHARESLLETNNPFDRLVGSEIGPGTTVVDRPNSSILVPAQTSTQHAELDMEYALGPHSTISTVGSFFNVTRSALAGAEGLGDTRSASGHMVYSRQIRRRRWVGLDYGVEKLTSRNPGSAAFVQSLAYTETLGLTPNSVLSIAGGPERTVMHDGSFFLFPPNGDSHGHSTWNWAGSATYYRSAGPNTLLTSYSRRISNGEGLLGIVRVSTLSMQLQNRISRGWYTNLLASYDREKTANFTPSGLSFVSAAGGIRHTLSPNLSLEFLYWRIHELLSGPGPDGLHADHNRLSLSLTYNLTEMIGK
ncbi:MAG: hypothetical protein DMG60_03380 [Acidobacteria bacterium]|nr:MAG: hypothetical protein DMG60_03380 [Acidobacteriota bacterium]